MIKTFQPRISLTLRKVQRRLDAARLDYLAEPVVADIDLTGYLGERGAVTVARGIHNPGTFSAVFTDKMDLRSMDSIYALFEPMDILEIRFGRAPGAGLPALVMRGVVSSVSRNESVSSDGRPARSVTVSGHDFSKFLQTAQLCYNARIPMGEFALSIFPLAETYGLFMNYTASGLVEAVMDRLITGEKGFLAGFYKMSALSGRVPFKTKATVEGARVGPYGMQPYEGDVWGLLNNWCDIGWNELFVEDREDAAYLVYRPAPYYKLGTNELVLADAGAQDPGMIEVGADEIEGMHLTRSDQNVANFFRVDCPQAELAAMEMVRAMALNDGQAYVGDHPNCDPRIFGLKQMQMQTQQGPDGNYPRNLNVTKEQKETQASHLGLWYTIRRDQLKAMNIDNAVFEGGQISMRGNEAIRPGMYVRVNRGALRSRYYVTHVTHQFMPLRAFKTSIEVERGEGYADRRNTAGSPYFAETAV